MSTICKDLAKKISKMKNIFTLTGAGISAPSKIPIYGGAQGMWAKLAAESVNAMLLLRKSTVRNSPKTVWNWVQDYKSHVDKAIPNEAHKAVLKFQEYCHEKGKNCTLITQNIDGIHSKLIRESKVLKYEYPGEGSPNFGFTPYIIELHGNVNYMRCNEDCSLKLYSVPKDLNINKEIPKCPTCKSNMRPHMLLFDEAYGEGFYNSTTAINEGMRANCMIIIGSGLMGQLASCLAYDAVIDGKLTVEMNTEKVIKMKDEPNLVHINGSADHTVPELFEEIMKL